MRRVCLGSIAIAFGAHCATAVAACNALVNAGATVAEIQFASPTPAAGGGTLLLGHYYLTQWHAYTDIGGATGPTGNTRRQVVYFSDATHADVVRSDNGGPDDTFARTYSISEPTLTFDQTCPVADTIMVDYSVLDNGVNLALISPGVELILQRDEIFADAFDTQ